MVLQSIFLKMIFFNFRILHLLDSHALCGLRYKLQWLHCVGCIHASHVFVIDAKSVKLTFYGTSTLLLQKFICQCQMNLGPSGLCYCSSSVQKILGSRRSVDPSQGDRSLLRSRLKINHIQYNLKLWWIASESIFYMCEQGTVWEIL